jgi:RNA polymerase sigma factor (sigma-70 family)
MTLNELEPLVIEARTGDQLAVSKLWQQLQPIARRVAAKYLTDQTEIDIASSAGMNRVITKLHLWSGQGAFGAWFVTVIRNAVFSWIRQYKAPIKQHLEIGDWDSPVTNAHRDPHSINLLMSLIDKLPARQQESFKLVVCRELSYEEAGSQMGTTAGAVKSNVHDAKTKLRKLCTEAGLTLN